VTIGVAASGDTATLTVTDTGIGLAAGDLERVFERFYRVHGVDRPPGGSGIGLAIARAVARAHGGDLVAASEGPGRGTTFTLRLPAASHPPAA
jgi:histidine kinase